MFRWKSLHQAAPAAAQTQTSAPLQPRIFGKLKFPKHFQRSHSISTRSGSQGRELYPITVLHMKKNYQTRCNNNRMVSMKSICEYQVARGKDRMISVILMASLPAKFADFPSLCCQVGVQNTLGWRYACFYDCIWFHRIAIWIWIITIGLSLAC